MKVIKVTPVKEAEPIYLVVGPGVFYKYGEVNQATIIETLKGVILVKEKPEEITRLIKGE